MWFESLGDRMRSPDRREVYSMVLRLIAMKTILYVASLSSH